MQRLTDTGKIQTKGKRISSIFVDQLIKMYIIEDTAQVRTQLKIPVYMIKCICFT